MNRWQKLGGSYPSSFRKYFSEKWNKIEDKKEESFVLYSKMLALSVELPPTIPKLRKHRKINDGCII